MCDTKVVVTESSAASIHSGAAPKPPDHKQKPNMETYEDKKMKVEEVKARTPGGTVCVEWRTKTVRVNLRNIFRRTKYLEWKEKVEAFRRKGAVKDRSGGGDKVSFCHRPNVR